MSEKSRQTRKTKIYRASEEREYVGVKNKIGS